MQFSIDRNRRRFMLKIKHYFHLFGYTKNLTSLSLFQSLLAAERFYRHFLIWNLQNASSSSLKSQREEVLEIIAAFIKTHSSQLTNILRGTHSTERISFS